MGGSGGSGGGYLSQPDLTQLRKEAQKRLERGRIDAIVNEFLQRELGQINDRDTGRVNERLDEIERAIGGEVTEFDRLLLGGSVAKHTYVDGLSDIDSLVVLTPEAVGERSPEQMRAEFASILRRGLNMADVEGIGVGNIAVTVTYRDGTQIQLLPAIQSGASIAISSSSGSRWVQINPKEFSERLSRLNASQGGSVVPAIKIAKAIVANEIPEKSRPTGYHMEALAMAAFQDYQGPKTPRAMTEHFFQAASDRVLRPISDVTGQSRFVDEALGGEGSPQRRSLGRRLGQLSRRMRTSTSVSDWKALLDE